MSKKRVKGHAANSKINGEWGAHVKKGEKKSTSGKRRIKDKKIIRDEINLIDSNYISLGSSGGPHCSF
jgi:hypothetical protein